jgi:hypothetical protein
MSRSAPQPLTRKTPTGGTEMLLAFPCRQGNKGRVSSRRRVMRIKKTVEIAPGIVEGLNDRMDRKLQRNDRYSLRSSWQLCECYL